jgi:DNA-binding protein HU-beta
MNKNELAVQMTEMTGATKVDALKVIDLLVEVVSDELNNKNGKLTLVGFGTFKTIVKQKKKGRNPRTGASITIPEKNVVKFIPGKKLKEIVNS